MEKLVTSLFKAIAGTNELIDSDSAIIERDNEVFDRVASWFRDLRTALGYDENSEEANNLEITFLQGLHEKLGESNSWFAGSPSPLSRLRPRR
ncbi:MAG: Phosphoenolpyruvate carboxylase [Candidatus Midichloria mitochondrii]|uniref:Uncharacterized protein n=1 Tax=Midichloria mitochondrii (strain IricVA) TaxID=696127 RepID=F7XU31_MIDMI|nr:hypothetical protein midi_01113 [Candidatus Midichloria mitochondrii IricVA]MDJ1255948.1 hypothetical protein [Candidatus Midichloria mitochondrii]MDJ1287685.1 hypothetical protein [Candidatus Midichloria mitochondrii]MDJ1298548.1 hypothetical protein [Candidatus Midichloria mitochondrii]MDJ1312695.1 hypothetical protein [Candidatus Midichloria mitochondrii]